MALGPEDRALLEAVPLCGPKMADYLGLAGVARFDDLADMDAATLRLAINAALGRPHINAMGVRAIQNAIEAARARRAEGML